MTRGKTNKDSGLYLRGNVWYSRIAGLGGQMVRKRLSSDISVARAILAEMRKQFELRKAGFTPANIGNYEKDLNVLQGRYIEHCQTRGKAANTILGFQHAWMVVVRKNRFQTFADITIPKIEAWAAKKLAEGTRGQTINLYVRQIDVCFKWAHKTGLIPYNPLTDWLRVKPSAGRFRRDLRPEEVKAILDAETDLAWRTRWHVYFFTGLRLEAGAEIQWDWINWESRIITLPLENNKSGRVHRIAMHPALCQALVEYRAKAVVREDGRLFFPIGGRSIRNRFLELCGKAGVDTRGICLHSVRHTVATRMYELSGKNLKAVQELLGHASIMTTARYLHVTDHDMHSIISKLDYGLKSGSPESKESGDVGSAEDGGGTVRET